MAPSGGRRPGLTLVGDHRRQRGHRRRRRLPRVGADQSEGCFGIQPDLIARIAVIPVGKTTLLAWERTDKAFPNKAYVASFEKMLQSVRFR